MFRNRRVFNHPLRQILPNSKGEAATHSYCRYRLVADCFQGAGCHARLGMGTEADLTVLICAPDHDRSLLLDEGHKGPANFDVYETLLGADLLRTREHTEDARTPDEQIVLVVIGGGC